MRPIKIRAISLIHWWACGNNMFDISNNKKNTAISLLLWNARGDRGSCSLYNSYSTWYKKSSVLLRLRKRCSQKECINVKYRIMSYMLYFHLWKCLVEFEFKFDFNLIVLNIARLFKRRKKPFCCLCIIEIPTYQENKNGLCVSERSSPVADWFGCNSDNRPPLCFTLHNSLINAVHPKIAPLQHEIELNHLDTICNWLEMSKKRGNIINNLMFFKKNCGLS